MKNYTPYTYLIGWSKLQKFYYGVRFAKGCHPSDFWIKYFTSSRFVKNMRNEHGEPDIFQIRKTFEDKESAILWETKVLQRINARDNPKMLNANNNKIPEKQKDFKYSDESRDKMRKAKLGKPSPHIGKKLSEEHKQKLKDAKIGYVPWNKGLRKEDFPSLSRENMGKRTTKPIKSGKRGGWNKGLRKEDFPSLSRENSGVSPGFIWINNGEIQKHLPKENTIPDGWSKGMIKRK